ncbi:MAG: FecR domain-containing protein [Pseudomonadota bacterium]
MYWFRAAAFSLIVLSPLHAASNEVGILAAVNLDVTGERPTENPRLLSIREKLITNERVTTSASGGGQVLFLDQTSLTLSPSSDIVLDKYVYDPNTQAGGVTVSVLKGAMRLVGGRITKTNAATIRTPSATIGIRGGIGQVNVRQDGSAQYLHIAGESSTITTEDGEIVVTREGGAVEIGPPADGGAATDDGAQSSDQSGDDDTGGEITGTTDDDGDESPGTGTVTFVGVADDEFLGDTIGLGSGTGDGGSTIGGDLGPINAGLETSITPQVFNESGAPTKAPISTTGEQQSVEFGEQPPAVGDQSTSEVADSNQAEDLAEEIDQLLDGVAFSGVWAAVAGLSDGGFAPPLDDLQFRMRYSLVTEEGVVTVELPDTGDLAGPNLTTFDGDAIAGDRFIVVGDGPTDVVGDGSVLTVLGGDASDSTITLTPEDIALGSIFIDYDGSTLANTDFVEGVILPVTGVRTAGDAITNNTVNLRQTLEPSN